MRTIKLKASVLTAIVFMLLAGMLHAEEPRRAGGWIDSFSGAPESYMLQRDRTRIPVAIYMPVYVGDRIELGQDQVLKIGRSDGTVLELGQQDTPYTIQESDDSVTLMDNFLEWASGWFGKYMRGGEHDQAISMLSRTDTTAPISMSLFPNGQANIRSGKRTIALYWEGGKPPYGVKVRASNRPGLLVDLAGIETGKVVIGPLDLAVGLYDLEVYDQEKMDIVRIEAVPGNRYPAMPSELTGTSMPGDMMNNLEAMWLASQENGNWILEAYQLLVSAGNEPSAASILRKALEKGVGPVR